MVEDLPTELRLSAARRTAAAAGVFITVIQKGDPTSGSICLKINLLDGRFRVLSQIRDESGLAWLPASEKPDMTEAEADAYLAQQLDFDPDLWVIEIEDKEGRHWFNEKIITQGL